MMDTLQYMIEELALSGIVGVGNCSKSTLYRYVRRINERLTAEKCDWRVKADAKNMSIVMI